MKLLAFDSSSKVGSIALLQEQNGVLDLLGEWTLNIDNTFHSERLLWGVHHLLESSRTKLEDIDVFAVGTGPGSFTGLRIGLTTARTLAHTLNKPLVGVSSLAALARPAAMWIRELKQKTILIAATDAAKGELFALWGAGGSIADCVVMKDGDHAGLWKSGVKEDVLTPDALITDVLKKLKVKGSGKAQWMVVGEGKNRFLEQWKKLPKSQRVEVPIPFSDCIQGRYIGILAWEAYQAGLAREALEVHPRYLRASDAEVKLKAGLLPVAPGKMGNT